MLPPRTICLTLQYNGKPFSGFQLQPNRPSVQQAVETALKLLTGQDIRILQGSRTDAGVHALDQCVTFTTSSQLSIEAFHQGLNHFLGVNMEALVQGVCVSSAQEMDAAFHARWSAHGKLYYYYVNPYEDMRVFLDPFSYFVPKQLDVEAMQTACHYLVGSHDFASFRSAGCASKHSIREIFHAAVTREALGFLHEGRHIVRFAIAGNAFLKQMVRNIVGTLIDVGRKNISCDDFLSIIAAKDRTKAGMCAPARGLVLRKIYYEKTELESDRANGFGACEVSQKFRGT